jgi:hypothetical protein
LSRSHQIENPFADCCFAGAAFADEPDGLASRYRERNIGYGFDMAGCPPQKGGLDGKPNRQILDFNNVH